MTSPSWRGIIVLVAVCAAGVLAGVALDRIAFRREWRRAERVLRAAGNEPPRDGIPERLRNLGLTPAQEARIRAISARYQPRADSLMRDLFPRVRDIEQGMFQEMVCVLTPAQDSAYMEWRRREGLNMDEGREQLSRVEAGTCPAGADSGR
jgi:hypothetical protein